MKALAHFYTLIFVFLGCASYAQNSPFSLWGGGLDGSTYQQTAIYSDATLGLLFDAPKNSSGARLPIQFNWRGGGPSPLYISPNGNTTLLGSNPINFTASWTSSPDNNSNVSEISNDAGYYKQLMIVGNKSQGSDRRVGIWDRLSINGAGFSQYFNVNGSSFFNGSVGIGTNTLSHTLNVNGKILAEEVKVVVDVPADYVFAASYHLRSLEEVETYTRENKHLPGIPSARELTEEGWQLGEMSNRMLEKIEELTLYVIEVKKENEALKKQVDELKKYIKP